MLDFYEIDLPYVDDNHKNLILKNFDNIWNIINCKILNLILSNELNPNVTDLCGNTLLHSFVRKKDLDLVKIMLKYKADPNILNNKLLKPIQCIDQEVLQNFFCNLCITGDKESILVLLRLGVKSNIFNKNHGDYPYNIAKDNKHYELMNIIKLYYTTTEEFYLLCPIWELNKFYKGKFIGEKKLFQDKSNKVIYGVWTDTKNWEVMKKNKRKNVRNNKFYHT